MPAISAEERVETMIAEGLRITREAVERYRPSAVVAAYSSGDDSMVSTHFAMSHLADCFVFNADTMVGLAPARCHLKAVCDRFRWTLEVERATPTGPPKYALEPNPRRPGKKMRVPFDPARHCPAGRWLDGATAYEEKVLNWGFPGRGKPQHARMYQTLKEDPIRKMLRRFGASKPDDAPKVLLVSGIRGDESAVRAGYKRAVGVGHFGDVWVNPFYWRTAADFAAYRDEFGLPSNPVKRRCGISGECCCGTFPNETERAAYAVADPAFDSYLSGLEARVRDNGLPWGWGESPPDWWKDRRRGQSFLFDAFDEPTGFQPMCVGCHRGGR